MKLSLAQNGGFGVLGGPHRALSRECPHVRHVSGTFHTENEEAGTVLGQAYCTYNERGVWLGKCYNQSLI